MPRESRWRRLGVVIGAGLLLLSGCAAPASVQRAVSGDPAAAGDACPLDPVAHVSISLQAGLPIIEARIRTRTVRLVLDTGAERTLLTPAAAARLGLPRDPRSETRTAGIGGTSEAYDADLDRITLGGETLALPGAVVGALSLGTPGAGVDGLLGGDLWRRYDVDLDLPARMATLYDAHRCHRAAPPWAGPAIEIDGLDGPPWRLLLPVSLDHTAAAAVFDTGAQVSGVSARLALRAPAATGPSRAVFGRGAGAGVVQLQARRFASFRVGPLLFADPVLPILPLPRPIDALIGEDIVRGCRVWFSFAARQVFLAAPGKDHETGGHITLACPRSSP